MGVEQRLAELGDELRAMLQRVGAEPGLGSADLRHILGFFSKVVEVVEQAFRDVYRMLIEVRFAAEEGAGPERRLEVRQQLALLRMRDRYRDAEQICTRLHFLGDQYRQEIQPKVPGLAYGEMLSLLDEHEGRIMALVSQATFDLETTLPPVPDPERDRAVAAEAARQAAELRRSLAELHALQNRILGLSGRTGLLELLGADVTPEQRGVIVEEVIMGDRYEISGQAGSVGPHSTSTGNTFTQVRSDAASAIDAAALQAALADLHAAIGRAGLPVPQAIGAQTAVGNALEGGVKDGAVKPEALVPNLQRAGETLKQANVVVQQGSSLWDSVRKLAPLVGPLVGGAHVVAAWFGVPLPA